MKTDTFCDITKYKSLEYVIQRMESMIDNDKTYLASFIVDFNSIVKKTRIIEDKKYMGYVLGLVRMDFIKKIDAHVSKKHEYKLSTHLKNYIYAKTKV